MRGGEGRGGEGRGGEGRGGEGRGRERTVFMLQTFELKLHLATRSLVTISGSAPFQYQMHFEKHGSIQSNR